MLKDTSLIGKRVLITAAASGIGLVMARGFIEAGARVFICDVSATALKQVQNDLPALRGCLADVADEAQVQAMFAQADAALGGLDVLVNNAGIAGPTAQQVARMRTVLEGLNLKVATSNDAREMLKLKGPDQVAF